MHPRRIKRIELGLAGDISFFLFFFLKIISILFNFSYSFICAFKAGLVNGFFFL